LVVTICYRVSREKTYKLTNIPNNQLEGNVLPLIAFRIPSEKFQQLEEFLQKVNILPLKKGEPDSKKYQLLIEKLLSGSLFTNPSKVTGDRLHTRRCYMKEFAEVSIREMCGDCLQRSPKEFLKCPDILKMHGIEPDHVVMPKQW